MKPFSFRMVAIVFFAGISALPAVWAEGAGIDQAALDRGLAVIPAPIAERIKADRSRFDPLLADVLAEREDLLVLVDKTHALSSNFVPPDLSSLDRTGLSVSRKGLELRKPAVEAALAMSKAAKRDGVVLVFSSTYRSYAYQKTVHERIAKEMGEEEASRESAEPGHSQHQLGTASDFGSIDPSFASTKAGKWLALHAGEYGFSLSFPRGAESITGYMYEPWHFRYIGVAASKLERAFFEGTQQYLLAFLHEYRGQR